MLKFITQRVVQNLTSLFALGILFFAIAGTLDVPGFWLYVATVLVYQVASLLGSLSFPLIAGSGIALLGSALCIGGMVVRTALEDRTLRQDLAGYSDYAQAVRYRLIPRVW